MRKQSFFWLFIFLFFLSSCTTPGTAQVPDSSSSPSGGQEIITGSAPESAEEIPLEEAKAELVDFNCAKTSYSDKLTCFGLVKNTGKKSASVMVILTSRDDNGNLETRESTSAYHGNLPAGMVSAFQFYELSIDDCEKCEVILSPMTTDWEEPYIDFKILSENIKPMEYMDGYEIIGEIQNTGSKDCEYPTISGALFDDEGKVIGIGISFPDVNPLPAGQISTFSLLFTNLAEGNFKTYQIYPVVGSAK